MLRVPTVFVLVLGAHQHFLLDFEAKGQAQVLHVLLEVTLQLVQAPGVDEGQEVPDGAG